MSEKPDLNSEQTVTSHSYAQTARTMPLDYLMATYRPGSYPEPWSWDEEAAEVLSRECLCCGKPGHYQRQLEAHILRHGLTEGVYLGRGRVLDGNHRIAAAIHLGITDIPLELGEESHARWLRDHGPIDWHERKVGDRLSWEQEWRHRRLRGDFGEAERLQALTCDSKAQRPASSLRRKSTVVKAG